MTTWPRPGSKLLGIVQVLRGLAREVHRHDLSPRTQQVGHNGTRIHATTQKAVNRLIRARTQAHGFIKDRVYLRRCGNWRARRGRQIEPIHATLQRHARATGAEHLTLPQQLDALIRRAVGQRVGKSTQLRHAQRGECLFDILR